MKKRTRSASRSRSRDRSESSSKNRHRSKSKTKKRKHNKDRKRRRSSSSSSTSSSSSSSSSSTSSSSSSRERKRKEKKRKKKRKKKKKHKQKEKSLKMPDIGAKIPSAIGPDLPNTVNPGPSKEDGEQAKARAKRPMTKEEWEKSQSVIRHVYDPETGRNRLVKGDGEILEEIVSKQRQKEINKQATRGDGMFFATKLGIQDR